MKLTDLPIEPYDENYLSENKIKHMSFHAYVRKMQDRNRSSGLPLETNLLVDFVDDLYRKTHNVGKGKKFNIKEMAQPIFLERQPFRLVDHVEFETSAVVDGFLQAWRKTGVQRFGYLYGRYEPHLDVPLGIKAVVSCIYEPPQQAKEEEVELELPDRREEAVNGMANMLGLVKLGVIYTDLKDDGTKKGTVLFKRHAGTFFLSSPEIYFAATLQNAYPSPSRYTTTGKFGSKFVTVVVSGNEKQEISLEAYQVSNQAMALVKSEIVFATQEATEMCVRESNLSTSNHSLSEQASNGSNEANMGENGAEAEVYVPDILFKNTNEYGATFIHRADPSFPVEHFIVNVGHGFPKEPKPFFITPRPFPIIENRSDHVDASLFKSHLNKGNLLDILSDFHLLYFILDTESMQLETDFSNLLTAIRTRDQSLLAKVTSSVSWKNLQVVLEENAAKGKFQGELKKLRDMGFSNDDVNLSLLKEFNGNIFEVVKLLTS